MDYSQLSDFEINKRVAICCGFAPEDCEIAKLGTSIVGVEWDDETGYAIKTVDYCKSPSDAEPIIVDNRIGIIPAPENGLWKAAHRKVGGDSTPYHMTQDENPPRCHDCLSHDAENPIMLSPSQSIQYQKESVERALTCAKCGQKLHVLEVHVCSDCCAELMSDPNSSMYEEEDDE